jgi:predicted ABC-type transport system involved in lysophospholipase L1 biosynthesis ATPase subunit
MTQSTVQLSVAQGERIAVMGSSGSGKSSLLNLVCGLDDPTTGAVSVAGIKISDLNDDQPSCLRREKIGVIFQTFNLLPTLSAVENAALPLRLQGIGRKPAEQGAAAMPEPVGQRTRITHRPDEMSGDEGQRVAIARAIIFSPPLLRGDQPSGNLDSATGEEILALLDGLRQGVQQRPVSGDAQRPCRQLLRSCGHPSRWSHRKRTAAHTALAGSRA